MDHKRLFITGIGTGIGKTAVSAILTQHLQAAYWKPVQAGDLEASDSMFVRERVDEQLTIYPEAYRLHTAASPHQAAHLDGISIHLEEIRIPEWGDPLVVEGAGGLFVPLNDEQYIIDLVTQLQLPVVLVVRDYLGCINHTLLSLAAIKQHEIPLACVVFNGDFNPWTKRVLYNSLDQGACVLRIPELETCGKEEIKEIAAALRFAKKEK